MAHAIAEPARRSLLIALAGNPNTGKSTVFNRLTGLRQRVGNYPGVTVEKRTGRFSGPGGDVTVIDLPGAYTLAASSPDERVVVDALSGHLPGSPRPDLVVCVVDATNLRRNLFFASQIADAGLPLVIAANLIDEAEAAGQHLDVAALSAKLGVPVIPMAAKSGRGVEELRAAILAHLGAASDARRPSPQNVNPDHSAGGLSVGWPDALVGAADWLGDEIRARGGDNLAPFELHRLIFDPDSALIARVGLEAAEAQALVAEAREMLRRENLHPLALESLVRYRHLDGLLAGLLPSGHRPAAPGTRRIDNVLTHRVFGLLIFLGLMYVMFQSVYTWAGPVMDAVEALKVWAQERVGAALADFPMLQSLVADGVVEGVGSVLIFLPQILVLFLFIGLLEDSGYMARAAFLMDKLLQWGGLNGKSFVPLLSSFACAVPGVMSTRTIEDPKARLATILIAPLMSCSARLPVYVLMIGAFIEPAHGPWVAGLALFGMHFLGLIVAAPVSWIFNTWVLRTKPQPFLLELPPYRLPRLQDLLWRIWERGWEFTARAGTIIFALTIIIWALLYFPRDPDLADKIAASAPAPSAAVVAGDATSAEDATEAFERRLQAAQIEQSWMGRMGRWAQPFFAPAGFDWKITIGILASFPAREVLIATLGITYNLGGDVDEETGSLRQALADARWDHGPLAGQPVFTMPVVVAVMVFYALCMQCGATLAVIARESNWRWAVVTFVYMTGLAWLAAVATYQIGRLI